MLLWQHNFEEAGKKFYEEKHNMYYDNHYKTSERGTPNLFMTAAQAKAKTDKLIEETVDEELQEIMRKIEKAVENRAYMIYLSKEPSIYNKRKLEEAGYKYEGHYDQRDQSATSYTLSWN